MAFDKEMIVFVVVAAFIFAFYLDMR